MDNHTRHYHIATLSSGNEFIAAANKLLDGLSFYEHSTPIYYLYCHGIELALKSWISFKCRAEPFQSIDKKLRRDIRHNLQSAWEQARELGLSNVSPDSQKLEPSIKWMNPFYQEKHLEYYQPGKTKKKGEPIEYPIYDENGEFFEKRQLKTPGLISLPEPREFRPYVEQLVTDLDHHYRTVFRAEKDNVQQVIFS